MVKIPTSAEDIIETNAARVTLLVRNLGMRIHVCVQQQSHHANAVFQALMRAA